MKRLIRTIAILCFIWLTGGCEKDTEPTWIAPKMEIQVVPQDDIKRKSAILKGNIGENDLEITECGFLYSINKTLLESKALGDKDVIKVPVEQTSGEVKVQLEELIPGTNYFYCLFITCGNTTVISPEILQFATVANNAPELDAITLRTKDNQSITVASEVISSGAESIELRGVCYVKGTEGDPKLGDNNVAVPEGETDFVVTISNLSASTDYTIRAFAMNNEGIVGYGKTTVIRTENSEKPTVRTYDEPTVRGNYAVVTAEVTDAGTSAVTSRGFCWSSTNSTPMLGACDGQTEMPLTESNVFAGEINKLKEGTVYHIRAYATNGKGTGYGNAVTITTTSVTLPEVTITTPTFTTKTADLSAAIASNGGGTITEQGFCWSASVHNPQTGTEGCEHKAIEGDDFKYMLEELTPGTTYYVTAYAVNEKGTGYSNVKEFKTMELTVPRLDALVISTPKTDGASVNCTLLSNGNGTVTERGFCWSTSVQNPRLDMQGCEKIQMTGTEFLHEFTGLNPGTPYYVTAYATNEAGTGYSQAGSFTTVTISEPTLDIPYISAINTTSAYVRSSIINDNNSPVTGKGFCYSTTNPNPTTSDKVISVEGNDFTQQLLGLNHGTLYYIRAFATNSVGMGYSSSESFTTTQITAPGLYSTNVSGVTINSAVLTATIYSAGNGTISRKGFCWSTETSQPDMDKNTHQDIEGNVTALNHTLTGLTPGKTYYVRAYAVNEAGVTYNSHAQFTTDAVNKPTFGNISVTDVAITTAKVTARISSNGNQEITRKGFYWSSTNHEPGENDQVKAIEGTGDQMVLNMSDLKSSTTYYVRAFATNSQGTTLSNITSFTTAIDPVPGDGDMGNPDK